MTVALAALFGVAVIGLAASIIAHLASFFGIALPGLESIVLPGLFAVWLPTIFLVNRLSADFPRKDLWKASLRGAPRWVGRAIMAVGAYAVVNFLVLFTVPQSELATARGLSGHATVFYATAAGVAYSALQLGRTKLDRRCTRGHVVSQTARFCEKCGSPVVDSGVQGDSAS